VVLAVEGEALVVRDWTPSRNRCPHRPHDDPVSQPTNQHDGAGHPTRPPITIPPIRNIRSLFFSPGIPPPRILPTISAAIRVAAAGATALRRHQHDLQITLAGTASSSRGRPPAKKLPTPAQLRRITGTGSRSTMH
jgi:hypothetical protein